MDRKIVSVIITNYNYARYLPQCINSVIQSDFDLKNLEIIIIDDASTDNSVEIIEQIIAKGEVTVRLLINDTNLQLIRSRNRGIANARGEFIFILDADNYIRPECLKKHYETMAADRELVACYAPVSEFSDTTNEPLGLRSNKEFNYKELLRGNYIDAMAMFNRQHLVEAGMYNLYLPPDLWEDYELWLRLGKSGRKVAFIDGEPLSCYRVHQKSKISTASSINWYHVVSYIGSYHKLKYRYAFNVNQILTRRNAAFYAQLCFTETENVIAEVEPGIREISFIHTRPVRVTGLRFTPVNNLAEVQILSIDIRLKGISSGVRYNASSNALTEVKGYYLFDINWPVINFDFDEETELDEFLVKFEIKRMGDATLPLIVSVLSAQLEAKNQQIAYLTRKPAEISTYGKPRFLQPENPDETEKDNLAVPSGVSNGSFNNIIKTTNDLIYNRIRCILNKISPQKSEFVKNLAIIDGSNYFDQRYYLIQYPEVKKTGKNPAAHYLMHGGFEGKNPSMKFDSNFYLERYPDVKNNGINPLLHYLLYGISEGRKPLPPRPPGM